MRGVFLIDWSKINHANLILLFSFEFFVSSDFFIVYSCFFHQVCTIEYVLDLNFETNKVQFFTEINMTILFYRILYHIDFVHSLCTVLSFNESPLCLGVPNICGSFFNKLDCQVTRTKR